MLLESSSCFPGREKYILKSTSWHFHFLHAMLLKSICLVLFSRAQYGVKYVVWDCLMDTGMYPTLNKVTKWVLQWAETSSSHLEQKLSLKDVFPHSWFVARSPGCKF